MLQDRIETENFLSTLCELTDAAWNIKTHVFMQLSCMRRNNQSAMSRLRFKKKKKNQNLTFCWTRIIIIQLWEVGPLGCFVCFLHSEWGNRAEDKVLKLSLFVFGQKILSQLKLTQFDHAKAFLIHVVSRLCTQWSYPNQVLLHMSTLEERPMGMESWGVDLNTWSIGT